MLIKLLKNDFFYKIYKFIKDNKEVLIPLSLFFLIMLIVNFSTIALDDDLWFRNMINALEGGFNFKNLFVFTFNRYHQWSSRMPIEFLSGLFAQPGWGTVFRLLNSFMAVIVLTFIYKIVKSKSLLVNIGIMIVACTINVSILNEVGIVATSLNYLWPFAIATPAIFLMISYIKEKDYRPSKKYAFISFFLLLIYTFWSEQFALTFAFASICLFIMYAILNKKINVYYIFVCIFGIGFTIYALKCPGNAARIQHQTNKWFEVFKNYTFFDKTFLGIIETYKSFINVFSLIFVITLMYMVLRNKKNNIILKINAFIPLIFLIGFATIFSPFALQGNWEIKSFYSKYFVILFPNKPSQSGVITATYVPFLGALIGAIFFLSIFIQLMSTELNIKSKIIMLISFVAGLFSVALVSFSPVSYSRYRTSFIVVIVSLIIFGIFIKTILNNKTNKKYEINNNNTLL